MRVRQLQAALSPEYGINSCMMHCFTLAENLTPAEAPAHTSSDDLTIFRKVHHQLSSFICFLCVF